MNTGFQTMEQGASTWRVDAPVAVPEAGRLVERIPIDAITIRNEWYASVNRWIFFSVSVLLLIVLSPVIAVGALAVKLTSRRPAFCRQTRVGRNGQLFSIFKLHTMFLDAEVWIVAVWSDPDKDPRITLLRRLLRKTHVDEFPQPLNVLQGHMDLMGPRPERPEMFEQSRLLIPHDTERLDVRPGIRGLAQLLVGAERTLEDTERKAQHDPFHIQHLSPHWTGTRAATSPAMARWRRFMVVAGATMLLTGASIGRAAAVDFPPLEPVAIVTATPVSGTAPLTVTFDGSASTGPNTLVSWAWTFGDGTVGSGAVTSHTYTTPGSYIASLVVSDAFGLYSFPRTVRIDVAARVAPGAPLNLTATAASRSSIVLTWTNASTDQSWVWVERCKGTDCTRFLLVKTLAGTATSFTDTKLSPGTTYVYRVRAANVVGKSPYSNLASGRTLK